MSTQTQLTRIAEARNTIRNKLVSLGLAEETAKLDTLATIVDGIENRGAVSATVVEGSTYTIPAGYHNGSGTITALTDTEGEALKYALQDKSVIPTKSQQSVTPDESKYGLSSVTVAPIPVAYQDVTSVTAGAGDVLATKIIVDADGNVITGTMVNNGAINRTIDGLTTTSVAIPAGYTTGGTVSLTNDIETALAAI